MKKLNELLIEIQRNTSKQELININISSSNVGWHMQHIVMVINTIIEALQESKPSNYKWSFKFLKLIVFTTKRIPRGKAKSPSAVNPIIYDELILEESIKKCKSKIQELNTFNKELYFNHPLFGHLKLNKAILFLEIHTNHHLKIINDIINSKI